MVAQYLWNSEFLHVNDDNVTITFKYHKKPYTCIYHNTEKSNNKMKWYQWLLLSGLLPIITSY